MRIPELLAPAGNMEKLRIAVHYGADAIYLGGKSFGLRNLADNFSTAELAEAVEYAHCRGVKVYLTINAYADNKDLIRLEDYLKEKGFKEVHFHDSGTLPSHAHYGSKRGCSFR